MLPSVYKIFNEPKFSAVFTEIPTKNSSFNELGPGANYRKYAFHENTPSISCVEKLVGKSTGNPVFCDL